MDSLLILWGALVLGTYLLAKTLIPGTEYRPVDRTIWGALLAFTIPSFLRILYFNSIYTIPGRETIMETLLAISVYLVLCTVISGWKMFKKVEQPYYVGLGFSIGLMTLQIEYERGLFTSDYWLTLAAIVANLAAMAYSKMKKPSAILSWLLVVFIAMVMFLNLGSQDYVSNTMIKGC